MQWLNDIRAVRLGSSDLDASVRFATEIVGLQLVRRDAHRAYLRASSGQDHHVVYVRGDQRAESLAFEASSAQLLGDIAGSLARAGNVVHEATRAELDERYVQAMYSVTDPTGNRIELVHGPATGPAWTPSRAAGITSFSHVGLRTTNARADEAFWTASLGARVSDWIGEAPLLRIDEVHHRVALFPSKRPGIQHVNFQVDGLDDIMRAFYFLKARNVPIVFGPGRHPTSSAMFLYYQGPDDIVYEYSTGVRMITDEPGHVARRFPFESASFCMWGSKFSPDPTRQAAFYRETLGMKLSDTVGDGMVIFLRGASDGDHHLLGLLRDPTPGLHHASFEMDSVDHIELAARRVIGAGYKHVWGTGRHSVGSNLFHYFRDPWGTLAEYFYDLDYIPEGSTWEARSWKKEEGLFLWSNDGPPPPDFPRNLVGAGQ